jgi:hypothetical protein
MAITDFAARPVHTEQKLFKELALGNQYKSLGLPRTDFESLQALTGQLLSGQGVNPALERCEHIIRSGGSNRGIIRKLLADISNEA